jgi:hypothetical protein
MMTSIQGWPSPVKQGGTMSTLRDRLVGCWKLTDWGMHGDDAVAHFLPPLGLVQYSTGYIIYTAEGMMSATMSLRERPAFADVSMDGGTPAEKAEAFSSYLAYCGRFEVDETDCSVTHEVQMALQPSLVGQRLRRICIFDGYQLRLDTPAVMLGGKWRSGFIDWTRC